MAKYLVRLLDPFGHCFHDTRVELEDDGGQLDSLTGLMTTPEGSPVQKARFVVRGGHDPRAAYSIEVEKVE